MPGAGQERGRGPGTPCRGHGGGIPPPQSPVGVGHAAAASPSCGCCRWRDFGVTLGGARRGGRHTGWRKSRGEAGCPPLLLRALREGSTPPAAPPGPIRLGAARGLASPHRLGRVRGQCI